METSRQSNIADNKDRFRKSIRREANFAHMEQIRKKLLTQQDFDYLKDLISQLQDSSSRSAEMQKVLTILDQHTTSATFNMQINESMHIGFANVLLSHCPHLTLHEKSSLLSAFDYFTFYASQQPLVFKQKMEFLDCLMKEIGALKLDYIDEVHFLQRIVALFTNLSSDLDKDFSLYLAESDVARNIVRLIATTNNHSKCIQSRQYDQAIFELRLTVLKLFKNIVKSLVDFQNFTINLVVCLLKDEQYFICHPSTMFILLAEGMGNYNFYGGLLQKEETAEQQIITTIMHIENLCFSKRFLEDEKQTLCEGHIQDIRGMLIFLNQLYYQDSDDEAIVFFWQGAIELLFNGFMLAQFLKIAHRQNKKELLYVGLKTFSLLSESTFVSAEQLLIVRPTEDYYTLLKIWTNEDRLFSPDLAPYCFKIMTNLLRGDSRYHRQLMQLSIADTTKDVLEKMDIIPVLEAAITFSQALLTSDDEGEGRLLAVLENKGLIGAIEKKVDHISRQVYQKAEMFMEVVIQERRKHPQFL